MDSKLVMKYSKLSCVIFLFLMIVSLVAKEYTYVPIIVFMLVGSIAETIWLYYKDGKKRA